MRRFASIIVAVLSAVATYGAEPKLDLVIHNPLPQTFKDLKPDVERELAGWLRSGMWRLYSRDAFLLRSELYKAATTVLMDVEAHQKSEPPCGHEAMVLLDASRYVMMREVYSTVAVTNATAELLRTHQTCLRADTRAARPLDVRVIVAPDSRHLIIDRPFKYTAGTVYRAVLPQGRPVLLQPLEASRQRGGLTYLGPLIGSSFTTDEWDRLKTWNAATHQLFWAPMVRRGVLGPQK